MALPAFDTHAYIKRLKAAGFNEKQAEAQSELQAEVLSSLVTEKLATKDDLLRIEQDLLRIEHALREDMLLSEGRLKESIMILESQTKQEFIRLDGKFNLLHWMFGILLAGMVALLFKSFLH
jgi:hypothetical protein